MAPITPGRIVTYRGEDGREFPAVVSRVAPKMAEGDDEKQLVDLVVFDIRESGGTKVQLRVQQDPSHACLKNSWRWPERVS
jgi:hypothetical protein